jgi:hypothetical protein
MSFSSCRRLLALGRQRTRKQRSENSMELLPVEESGCYRCGIPRIGEIEPFSLVRVPESEPERSASITV